MLLLKTLLAAASLSTALGSPVLPSLGRSDELAFPPAGVARSQAVLTTTERQTEAEAGPCPAFLDLSSSHPAS